jgi:hypothetical protein
VRGRHVNPSGVVRAQSRSWYRSQRLPLVVPALAHLQVSASQLGDLAGIAGAGELVRSEIFAPAAIDAALTAG